MMHFCLQSPRYQRQVACLTVFRKMQCSLLPHPLDSLKLPQLKAYRSTRQSSASHQHTCTCTVVIPKSHTLYLTASEVLFSFLCQPLLWMFYLVSPSNLIIIWLICHLLRIYELWLGHPSSFLLLIIMDLFLVLFFNCRSVSSCVLHVFARPK